jgi:vanillate O-demethylase ferredoxin subunit
MRISAIIRAADDALIFALNAPSGGSLPPSSPGDHINVFLPNGVSRSYSLLEAEARPTAYRIAVKREALSRGGSAWMHETARVEDVIHVSPPANRFPLREDAPHSVFFAGGIGITPIWSMVRALRKRSRSFQLYYRARSRANAVLLDALQADDLRDRLHLSFSEDAHWPRPDIGTIVRESPAGSHFYCCGPVQMMDTFRAACTHVDSEYVHCEQFSAEAALIERGFLLKLRRSRRQLRIHPGETILQRLRGLGLQVPASCEQGVCGSCETRVLGGRPDHKDLILSPEEKRAGAVMMICCSGSMSSELELDL